MFKQYVQGKLEDLVKEYFAKHQDVKLVVVVGAAGKTTTKIAIATVLSQKYRVRVEPGNLNDFLSVPPAMLGVDYPDFAKLRNPFVWRKVFKEMKKVINAPSDVDVIVQELGTDHPGQIPHFGEYLKPDLAVVTSVVPEHMEYFGTIENVAREELSVTAYSKETIINRDDIDEKFSEFILSDRITTYGVHSPAENYFIVKGKQEVLDGFKGDLMLVGLGKIPAEVNLIGQHSLKSAIAAGTVGSRLGMSAVEISKGVGEIKAVPGRMSILPGRQDAIIIDDTYNSSPVAAIAALKVVYQIKAPQRFVILGSMNELGDMSEEAHRQVGEYCDPTLLENVVTVGELAKEFLAPAAKAKGNRVYSFLNPVEAGAFVSQRMQKGAVILAKGSQNGVFTEEAVKVLLKNAKQERLLVRQSPYWMDKKQKFFDSLK